jgi:hypothetical protein
MYDPAISVIVVPVIIPLALPGHPSLSQTRQDDPLGILLLDHPSLAHHLFLQLDLGQDRSKLRQAF